MMLENNQNSLVSIIKVEPEEFRENSVDETLRFEAKIFSDPIVLLVRLKIETTPETSNCKKKSLKSKKDSGFSEAAKILAKKGNENLACSDPHTCCVCQKVFSNRYTLRSHIDAKHCKTKKLFCDLCPKVFFTRTHMIKHMIETHGKKKFVCNICDFKTAWKQAFRYHKMTHAAKVPCPICNKEVSSIKIHMETHRPKIKCPICQKMYSKGSFRRHMKIHSRTKKVHKCENCEESFENKEDLRRHNLRSHFDGKLHECYCGSVFQHKIDLKRHKQSHRDEKISCEVCQRQFQRMWGLKRHWKRKHTETHGNLQSSRLRVLTVTGPLICDQCGSVLPSRESLQVHNNRKHRKTAKFCCDLCPKFFDQKFFLINHLKKDHLKLRPFKCHVCGHTSSTKQNSQIHMLQHGPKARCKVCNKLVSNMSHHLRNHEKSKCRICSKFYPKYDLSRHLKTHQKNLKKFW